MTRPVLLGLAALTVLAAPMAAVAAPVGPVARVEVSVAPEVAKSREFSASDLRYVQDELRRTVETQLSRKGALQSAGGELSLVIEELKPTRPTLEQMSAKPGLSFQSLYLGGVRLSGAYRAPDGTSTPIRYKWFESDLRNAAYGWTWSAAVLGFQRFSRTLTS